MKIIVKSHCRKRSRRSRGLIEHFEGIGYIGDGVVVEPSNIPNSGRGLFTSRAFKSGDFITEYDGVCLDNNHAKKIPTKFKTHMITLSSGRTQLCGLFLSSDANPNTTFKGRGGASFINQATDEFPVNCVLTWVTHPVVLDKPAGVGCIRDTPANFRKPLKKKSRESGLIVPERVFARAITYIPEGQELFASYTRIDSPDFCQNEFSYKLAPDHYDVNKKW